MKNECLDVLVKPAIIAERKLNKKWKHRRK